jgi:tryptophanyl-tRNA synthetase
MDLHVLTVDHGPARMLRLSRQATLLLAAGVAPERRTFFAQSHDSHFAQSHVSEHTELADLMDGVATDGMAYVATDGGMRRVIRYTA